ncbi:MAG TPA: VOC family protein [Terriglobia bacterium]|nr:VOC family protein [Terriglobia bacterium]
MANAKPLPEGYHSISPTLICRGADSAIEFYKSAFGAVERSRMSTPDGKIGHAELMIGDSMIFLSDEMPQWGSVAPTAMGGFYLYLYVEDVDTVFNRAIAAGARSTMPVQDMFWGDRYGKLTDPFGYQWGVATHTEDVTPEDMDRRAKAWMAKAAAAGQ